MLFFPFFSRLFFYFGAAERQRERQREREREKEREGEREGEGGRGSVRVCVCVERSRVREATKKIGERGWVLRWRADVGPRPLVEKKNARRGDARSRGAAYKRDTPLDARLSTLENPRSPASKLRAFTLQEQPLVCLSNALSPNNAFRHRSPRCRCPGCGFRHAISPSRFHRGEPFRRRAPIRRRFGREKGLEEILRREQQRKQQQQL